ncbi:MAG: dihydropteroate synthase [Alphaproteobacteria bacterium]|nr:dihydropteroate synthase [Alphaproteobacteria bacterium]
MIYLSIGSNSGARLHNLREAAKRLVENGVAVHRTSPIYETAAFLPSEAPDDWNKPYLNAAIEVSVGDNVSPADLLRLVKNIEREMGAPHTERWAPRIIDIDIVFWNGETVSTKDLKIPHPEFARRAFVLDPMSHLCPRFTPPGGTKTILEMAHENPQHQPVVMGILNLSPDSFSGWSGLDHDMLDKWMNDGIQIIDIGAESTNPKSTPLNPKTEMNRLESVFDIVKNKKQEFFSPIFSIDTYHQETAAAALDCGFNILNDVGGLSNPGMLSIASSFDQVIVMHSLTIPANPAVVINGDAIEELEKWLEQRTHSWESAGIPLDKLIFDPGIGFGKTANQSLKIVQNLRVFEKYGLRTLLGHSRKSFMKIFSHADAAYRDAETLGLSLSVAGADILRVHEPLLHKRSMLAKAHAFNQFYRA